MDRFALSYRTTEDGMYTGLWRIPGDSDWRPCLAPFDSAATIKSATAGEAIADAGHRIIGYLNKKIGT